MKNLIFCIIKSRQYRDTNSQGREIETRSYQSEEFKLDFIAKYKSYKNVSQAAKAFGIKPATAIHWVKKYKVA